MSTAQPLTRGQVQKLSRDRILAGHYDGFANRAWWGYNRGYVVPAWAMRDFLNKHKHVLQAEYQPPQNGFKGGTTGSGRKNDQTEGWRMVLATRLAARSYQTAKPITSEAAYRRIYGVMSCEQRTINAQWCDDTCLILGLDIDRDAQLPTLPGCIAVAKDLLTIRAENHAWEMNRLELQRLARFTCRLSSLIVAYPHNLERLLDLAPFNCLRAVT